MVRFVLFDLERASIEDFVSALSKTFPKCYEEYPKIDDILKKLGRSKEFIAKACGILYSLKRMGFELLTTPIPMPKENLKLLEGSKLKFEPKKSEISPEVIAILSEFCRTLESSFKIIEVYEFEGFNIIVGEYFDFDEIAILETNLDDVSGEIVGYALQKLERICPDVSAIQCLGKKGRPMITVRALCKPEDVERVAKVMMYETGSLGVRIIQARRIKENREIEERDVDIFGRRFRLRVKTSSASILKPEFEDVKRIAEDLNLPIVVVYKEILRKL